jgi:ABC-type lipoprotein export system ATPase subunit
LLKKLTIVGGLDKSGHREIIQRLDIRSGEMLAVAGPTGSGKTQLITDIEQHADGETTTGRAILLNDRPAFDNEENRLSRYLVAEVSQKMNFVIDMTVEAFLFRHARVRSIETPENTIGEVLAIANELAGEPISPEDNLTMLSGGQARALMVGDVAMISNAPIVLIDEIENCGIDRLKALEMLTGQGKIVLVVTHDPRLMLMSGRRVIMKNGGMFKTHRSTNAEKRMLIKLDAAEKEAMRLREFFRNGEAILRP